jgi:3-oxoadipate enol-lactonase
MFWRKHYRVRNFLPCSPNTRASSIGLANSLGTNNALWDGELELWSRDRTVICFDYPGHGSPPWSGQQTLPSYAKKIASLLDAIDVNEYDLCGISMGSAIGIELATIDARRMRRLVLSNTAPKFGARDFWSQRARSVMQDGISGVAEATLARWFTKQFASDNPGVVAFARDMLLAVGPAGYATCCEAIGSFDVGSRLAEIPQPTLVIAGKYDQATTVDQAMHLPEGIRDSTYLELDTAHIANLAVPDVFGREVRSFLTEH